MVSRRDILTAGVLGGVVAAQPEARAQSCAAPALPDLGFLRDTPVADPDRLRRFMGVEGFDALVVSHPANVFYLTNHWPQLDRMGFEGAGIAIFCRDRARPIALVMHAFLYYYTHTPESAFRDRAVYTYTQPGADAAPDAAGPPAAAAARTMRVVDESALTDLDRHRADMFARTRAPSADASWALAKAVGDLGLAGLRIGIDDPTLEAALRLRGFAGDIRAGENTIRRARLAKSPAELRLMRLAAQANVEAALAAARRTRELGDARHLRAAFFAEAAARGNDGHFMVIAGASSEVFNQPLRDGSAVSIDCVSTLRHYHGDFARTIFIGEPRAAVQRAVAAVAVAQQEICAQLRPGMRFADIPRIGREALRRQGVDLSVSFTPHSVGLFHTDHPNPSLVGPRAPDDLVLENDMILSVDCPVFAAGLGGTTHLEDLLLIRDGRAEPIHAVPPPTIVV